MKIFISWLGKTSHKVALVLRDWLPTINPNFEPWVSSEDIPKGTRWMEVLFQEIKESYFGIICLDQSNLRSPWLHFEAGAIALKIDTSNIAPLLFHVEPSQIERPFSDFQLTKIEKDDVFRLLMSLNTAALKEGIDARRLEKNLDYSWDKFRLLLSNIQLPESISRQMETKDSEKISVDDTELKILQWLAIAKEEKVDWSKIDVEWIIKALELGNGDKKYTTSKTEHHLRNLSNESFVRINSVVNDFVYWITDDGIDFLIAIDKLPE